MISLADILFLHESAIADYGGSKGVRDEGLLLSAVSRPFQTFDGKELYPGPIEKAAAVAESIISNHPFVDGNKRVGMLAMLAMLYEYGFRLDASGDDLYRFIISISTGDVGFDQIVRWLQSNVST